MKTRAFRPISHHHFIIYSLNIIYTVLQKTLQFDKLYSFEKHGLILVSCGKQRQHSFKMIRVFNFLCPFTFTYFICY